MSIIKQLAKRDHDKEQDVQLSCASSSVSSLKNDENLMHFDYYVLIDWLLTL